MKKIKFIFILVLISFISCKTLKEYIYHNSTDTCYINKIQYDSIYIKENIYRVNDTVYVNTLNYRYKYINDTIYRSNTDTVYQNKTITLTEYKLSGFSKFCIVFFIITVLVLVVYLIIKIKKLLI